MWIDSKGYVAVYVRGDHPCAFNKTRRDSWTRLHLLVFFETRGRLPLPGYHVHHKDGDKRNNSPDNLEERDSSDHGIYHLPPERARELGKRSARARKRARRKLERQAQMIALETRQAGRRHLERARVRA